MRSSNQLAYKERIAPEWYLDGPVKVYTPAEIQEWEKTRDPRMDLKIEMQSGLDVPTIMMLDDITRKQVEQDYETQIGQAREEMNNHD